MKDFKGNLIFGFISLVPIVFIIWGVVAAITWFGNNSERISSLGGGLNIVLIGITGLLLIILVSYLVGILVRTKAGAWLQQNLEKKLLDNIPGYKIINRILKGYVENNNDYQPALVRLFDTETEVIGLVMEKNSNGKLTVFIPSTPVITMGKIYIVSAEQVTLLDVNHLDLVNCITEWGVGSNKLQ